MGSEDLTTHFECTKNNNPERALKAPFDDGGVDGMMTDVGTNRTLIEQNARLIDKQAIDAGFGSILAGKQLHR